MLPIVRLGSACDSECSEWVDSEQHSNPCNHQYANDLRHSRADWILKVCLPDWVDRKVPNVQSRINACSICPDSPRPCWGSSDRPNVMVRRVEIGFFGRPFVRIGLTEDVRPIDIQDAAQ